jgi:hypothetical protein
VPIPSHLAGHIEVWASAEGSRAGEAWVQVQWLSVCCLQKSDDKVIPVGKVAGEALFILP